MLDPIEAESALRLRNGPRRPLVGVLENIRSMGNVGSMFRTADGLRMEKLMLCGFTAHPPRDEIEKTALGATESVPWEYWGSAAKAVHWLGAEGYRVLGVECVQGATPLGDCRLSGRTAMVVGHEVHGLSPGVLELCDEIVAIPMSGLKDSLNVAVAFGVAAYGLGLQLPEPR